MEGLTITGMLLVITAGIAVPLLLFIVGCGVMIITQHRDDKKLRQVHKKWGDR